jgi:hypothetical protein
MPRIFSVLESDPIALDLDHDSLYLSVYISDPTSATQKGRWDVTCGVLHDRLTDCHMATDPSQTPTRQVRNNLVLMERYHGKLQARNTRNMSPSHTFCLEPPSNLSR